MPPYYSDNLYSALDDESDYDEPIGESSTQHEAHHQGPGGVNSRLDTSHDTFADPSADNHASGSGVVDDCEDPHLFSPTDGYFGTASGTSTGTVVPASSNVPFVPNVLVEDPSLQRTAAEGKAREAEEERRHSPQSGSAARLHALAELAVDDQLRPRAEL
ncbi:hypothetical protein N0V88_000193 [Collariella sp. IMI 366227]|nr:hypothetical protein N0V88_000193 [Collariella sp. IMI 366227]